jgi:hypothetical protein
MHIVVFSHYPKIREDHHDPLSIASSSTERSLPVRDFTRSLGKASLAVGFAFSRLVDDVQGTLVVATNFA